MKKKKLIFILIITSIIVLGGCSFNEKKLSTSISSSENKTASKEDKLSDIVDLIVSEKYDEALSELEKLSIKETNNKEIKLLINSINNYKEGQNLFNNKDYAESKIKFENVINNEKSVETLKDRSKSKIEEIDKLISKEDTKSSETISISDQYINERNTLKKYTKNPNIIDTIPDSIFKEQYEKRKNSGIMDFVEGDIVMTFAKIYPDAEIDTSSFISSEDLKEITSDEALELVIQEHPDIDEYAYWHVERTSNANPPYYSVVANSPRRGPAPTFIVTMDGKVFWDAEYFANELD